MHLGNKICCRASVPAIHCHQEAACCQDDLLHTSSCQGVRCRSESAPGPLQRWKAFFSSSKYPGQENFPVSRENLSFTFSHEGHEGGTPRVLHSATRSRSSSFLPDLGKPFFARSAPKAARFFPARAVFAAWIASSCSALKIILAIFAGGCSC